MDDQSHRLYYEIIDEVCGRVAEEGQMHDIDREMLYSIQTEWINNLEHIQNEGGLGAIVPIQRREEDTLVFSDDEDMPDDEDIDCIEQNTGSYMVCLFIKVVKSKSKWKCSFKQGFINIDNDDIPFSTATGELEW